MSQQATASPPTARVLDILELLAAQETGSISLNKLARRLDITPSTAHAIVSTLCERGWALRDPVDKSLSAGPAFELTSIQSHRSRALSHTAHAAALQLSEELGFAASVTERTDNFIMLTFIGGGDDSLITQHQGERIPFAAPFGPAFAAWDSEQEQHNWIANGSITDKKLIKSLENYLLQTRNRGYSVERTTPALAETAQLIRTLNDNPWSETITQLVDEALAEIASNAIASTEDGKRHPVTSISTPVFGRHQRVTLNIAIHPLTELSDRRIALLGKHLCKVANAIGTTPSVKEYCANNDEQEKS